MRSLLYSLGFLFILSILISCKNDDDQVSAFKAENRKQLGLSAADLLSSDTYNSMTIEYVYAASFRPSDETIAGITNFLTLRVNKPNGISVVETMIQAPSGAPFTIDEIRDIEDEHRTQYTNDDTIAVYIFFANGNSSNDTDTTVTLGSAYQNTSIVIYKQTLISLINDNPGASLTTLETTVAEHEFGHLFGLVNIQDDDVHPKNHEDSENGRHCVVKDCLMFFQSAALKSKINAMVQRTAEKGVPVFDDLCIEDLQAKGGK